MADNDINTSPSLPTLSQYERALEVEADCADALYNAGLVARKLALRDLSSGGEVRDNGREGDVHGGWGCDGCEMGRCTRGGVGGVTDLYSYHCLCLTCYHPSILPPSLPPQLDPAAIDWTSLEHKWRSDRVREAMGRFKKLALLMPDAPDVHVQIALCYELTQFEGERRRQGVRSCVKARGVGCGVGCGGGVHVWGCCEGGVGVRVWVAGAVLGFALSHPTTLCTPPSLSATLSRSHSTLYTPSTHRVT